MEGLLRRPFQSIKNCPLSGSQLRWRHSSKWKDFKNSIHGVNKYTNSMTAP